MPKNGGRWTDGRYRTFITTALRRASSRWPPKYETIADAFVKKMVDKKTKRESKHFRCASCTDLFPIKKIQVDHIIPIGKCASWDEFIEKLFCEKDNLQVLCIPCHKIKSKKDRDEN
jgi:5-methylcytosine-specific restriction endonuclease McrA